MAIPTGHVVTEADIQQLKDEFSALGLNIYYESDRKRYERVMEKNIQDAEIAIGVDLETVANGKLYTAP